MKSSGRILSVDKPLGCTSFDVVSLLRRNLGWRSVGHAGTLDPAATGVLLVLCGDATERAIEFMHLPKEYTARIRFGLVTDTDDFEGDVLESLPVEQWSVDRISAVLRRFVGSIEQIPPAISAIKVGGRSSHRLARAGSAVKHPARPIEIYDIELISECSPEITIRIRCSHGTYIRSLARDLGKSLGWGGTLAELRRTAIGPFRSERALGLRDILTGRSEFSRG